MISELTGNFSSVTEFDKVSATALKPYFDIDFVGRDPDQFEQYFKNLNTLAMQNLGLAHCVVHNQSAQNVIQMAYKNSNLDCYLKPYGDHVGAYTFIKPVRTENVVLDGRKIQGLKKWASQLHNSDFAVVKIKDTQDQRRWVFVDLAQAPQKVVNIRDTLLGMRTAKAADIILDIELPEEWIVDQYVCRLELDRAVNFHNYGIITNYMSNCRALLNMATDLCHKYEYQIEYNLQCLDLQVRVLESLWTKNMGSLMQDLGPDFWRVRDSQYQFGKKTLTDIIHFCLQVFNTGMYDTENPETQTFRDALTFCSHITNLYRNLTTGNTDF